MCQSQSSKSEFHTALGGSASHMLFVIVFAVVGFLALYVAPAKAELIDAKGDFLYFLFLNENLVSAEDGSKEAPPLRTFDPKINLDSRGWHTQKMRAFMRRLERDYGIQAVSLTSWSLPSFSAYIPESTLGRLRADPRVREVHLVEDDEVFSTWGDQVAGNEIISWGKTAIGTNDLLSTANLIYMVDGKVPSHPDLNIVAISNVNSTALLAQDHAAHVAGILGARMNNIDTRGVNPGAGVIAVRRGDSGGTPEALDWAFRDAELRGIYAVLNLSSNSSSYRSTGVVGPFIRRVSNRLLVVLAGGNADAVSQLDACSTTYELTNSLDGILVVGGVDQDGKRAETFNNSPSGYSSSTSGSKRGACIEAWAPSTSIASTWMTAPYTWQVLSGTSMAAPHVAALAARYGNSATTPVEREQYLRNILQPTGYSDGSGLPVVVPSYLFGPGAVRSRLTVYSVTADSSVPNYGPLFTIDKLYSDPNKVWNSGHTAPAWIEFDLGGPQVITSMRLAPEQSPNGPSVHNVYIGASPGPTSLVTTISQSNSATLEPLVASMNAYGRYVRILTTSSSSWVAWREIEIYGYNPSYP